MNKKFVQIIFIALVSAVTALPLFFIDLTPNQVSEREKRKLQELPTVTDVAPDLSPTEKAVQLAREAESFVEDRIGFREELINIGQDIQNIAEPIERTDGGYVYLNGREGHKFFAYNNGWLIDKFQGTPLLSEDEQQVVAAVLNYIASYLRERDIPLIIFFCPDKDSVYPEYYPVIYKQADPPIPLDAVTNYMREHVKADVYNIKDTLISYKEKYLVYNKAEGDLEHYNSIGAFIEYQELIKHMQVYFPDMKALSFDDVTISYDEDGIPYVKMNNVSGISALGAEFFADLPPSSSWHYAGFVNDNASLPTALFIRDSYYDYGGYGYFTAANFHYSIGIHYRFVANFKEFVEMYKPDVVVIEVAERQIPSFGRYMTAYYEGRAAGE
ncbi:MAG: hypothetical protein LBI54_01810 [Lachnospiraceae bacterium]|jgi:hypothetical protein|nr:hypothetical protein [Lachnospiraceae bacterium]